MTRKMIRAFTVTFLSGFVAVASASAGQKVLQPIVPNFNCGFGCPVDAIKRGLWKSKPTDDSGANGVVVKVILSGATLGGVSANIPGVILTLRLSHDGSLCNSYQAPVADIVSGRFNLTFTGGETTPPLPEAGRVELCSPGLVMSNGANDFAVGAMELGSDPD